MHTLYRPRVEVGGSRWKDEERVCGVVGCSGIDILWYRGVQWYWVEE